MPVHGDSFKVLVLIRNPINLYYGRFVQWAMKIRLIIALMENGP